MYDQVAHMFHIMFTWSQFICYIILVLLLLALPRRSNVFCANVSCYRYICSKFIIAPMTHQIGSIDVKEQELPMFNVLLIVIICFSLYSVLYLYPCCFYKLLGFAFMRICRLLWFVSCYAAFMFCCLILLAKCYAFSLSILTLVPL